MARGYSLGGLVADLYKLVYPIGICVDFDNNTNPNDVFPGTTWTQIVDGRCYRTSSTNFPVGSMGGVDSIKLTIDQLPSHGHNMSHSHSIAHDHGQGWTNESGNHQHSVTGTTDSQGQHQHHFISLTQFNGAGATPAAVYAGAQRDSYTDAAGQHYHNVGGTADWAGNHTHAAWVPASQAGSGPVLRGAGTPNDWTDGTGSGSNIDVTNSYHLYARWKRTA